MEWNKTIAVTKDEDGNSGLLSLPVDDILFFKAEKGNLIAHTIEHCYYLIGGEIINKLAKSLQSSGYQFFGSDRGNLPNISKIRNLNSTWSRAYFTEQPDSKSKFVYIAKYRYSEFVDLTMQHNEYIRNNPKSRG